MKDKQILAAAEELNKLFFAPEPPQISTDPNDMDQVKADIKEAIRDCLKPDDELSAETLEVIEYLEDEKQKDEPEEEQKDEPEEEASLFEIVDSAKTLKDLVAIANAHKDLFKNLKLKGYSKPTELRDDMLDIIEKNEKANKPVKETPVKEKPTPKKEEVKEKAKVERKGNTNFSHAGSFAEFMDQTIKAGGTWDEMFEEVSKEAKKRNKACTITTLKTHAKFRLSKNPDFLGKKKITNDGIV